ncbi:hypothetical protein BDV26DRAFT_266276 [Aspergillus bertholletiae]|uniref:Uncharacterized protein n=1 Tax=Aspergillus bertholletiae TaxID=1226010 RepID=A0A5N7B2A0_9EURO|nr:hypothetical protein BDV26DRAFT_266276 [Aspergillus bertholletiae]
MFVNALAAYFQGLCEIALLGGLSVLNGLFGLVFQAYPSRLFLFEAARILPAKVEVESGVAYYRIP